MMAQLWDAANGNRKEERFALLHTNTFPDAVDFVRTDTCS